MHSVQFFFFLNGNKLFGTRHRLQTLAMTAVDDL